MLPGNQNLEISWTSLLVGCCPLNYQRNKLVLLYLLSVDSKEHVANAEYILSGCEEHFGRATLETAELCHIALRFS